MPNATPQVGTPSLEMPGYVEHSDGATEIGKLSAEAIVREYEVAARSQWSKNSRKLRRGTEKRPSASSLK
jgi:hypothetical protein